MDEATFRYSTYRAWLGKNADSIAQFKGRQQAAFDAERERWRAAGQEAVAPAPVVAGEAANVQAIPDGCFGVRSPIAGSVWSVTVKAGDSVRAGDEMIVVEAMKTRIAVASLEAGTVERVLRAPAAAQA